MNYRKITAMAFNLALAALAITTLPAQAAVPTTLNYQGQLASAAGVPVNSAVSMTFSLYDAASGGVALWSEAQSITVSNGLYSVTLGQTTPLAPAMFGVPLYLGIKVGTDAEMAPRIALTSSATALRAQLADSVSCTGCITAAQLAPGIMPASGVVPAGALITTASTTPPAGYSYTGSNLRTADSVWLAKAHLPAGANADATTVLNGNIYVIGHTYTGTNITEVYDPATDTWVAKAPLPSGMRPYSAAALNGKLYAIGSSNTAGTYILEVYDPATDTWLATAPVPTGVNLNYLGGSTALNGKLYAIGSLITGTYILEVYDPVTNTWLATAPVPAVVNNVYASTALNGKLYVAGQMNTGTAIVPIHTDFFEEYDPVADTWTAKAPLLSGMQRVVLTALNGNLYGGGGNGVFEEYDPVTDTWLATAPWPTTMMIINYATALNGKLYVIGTTEGIPSYVSFNQYDPVTDTWATKTPSLHAGYITVVNNLIYLFTPFGFLEEYNPALDFPLYVHVKQ